MRLPPGCARDLVSFPRTAKIIANVAGVIPEAVAVAPPRRALITGKANRRLRELRTLPIKYAAQLAAVNGS